MSADERTLETADALAFLASRYSVGPKHLGPPAPTRADLQRAVELALRAPDHNGLRPFRFVQVGDAQRDRLAAMFAADAHRRGLAADEVARARERAFNGPALLALVVRLRSGVDDVPEHEQWLSAGGALMNFLNALHLMGYGAKTLSGTSVRAPEIQAAFCAEGEQLAAWIVAGTPRRQPHAKPVEGGQTPPLTDWARDGC